MQSPFLPDPEELRKIIGNTEEVYSKGVNDGLKRGFRAGMFAAAALVAITSLLYLFLV